MIIETPDPATATGIVRDHYDSDLADDGRIFAHTRAMAVNPEALQAFEDLVRAIVPSIGARSYELATLAAAKEVGSAHCLLAHARRSLRSSALTEEEVFAVLTGTDADSLSAADHAVLTFAARLTGDAGSMNDDDTLNLRAAGFSDRQIVDIALAAAARNYFSRALLALAVPVEDVADLPARIGTAARLGSNATAAPE